MHKHKFSKTPMSDKEREKRAEDFINLSDKKIDKKTTETRVDRLKKEPTKTVYLRAPKSLWEDIQEIMIITGLSMNAICLELLRPGIKQKLKELKN